MGKAACLGHHWANPAFVMGQSGSRNWEGRVYASGGGGQSSGSGNLSSGVVLLSSTYSLWFEGKSGSGKYHATSHVNLVTLFSSL